MFRQQFPELGLSLERGTENVKDDGKYHLLVHGEVINSFTSEKRALQAYAEQRTRLIELTGWEPSAPRPNREQLLHRLRADMDARAAQAESAWSKRARAMRKGGKGGSGGVQ